MTNSQSNQTLAAELVAREQDRCRAFQELDETAMRDLLTDDYTHVHMNGRLEDKAAFMAAFKNRQRVVTREGLNVRIHGDAAIMTGRMLTSRKTDTGAEEILDSFATQTWVRQPDGWKLAAIQVGPYPA